MVVHILCILLDEEVQRDPEEERAGYTIAGLEGGGHHVDRT